MKSYPSKKTQHEMFQFFMRTSAPRLLKEAKEADLKKKAEKQKGASEWKPQQI